MFDSNYARVSLQFADAVRGAVVSRHSLQERLYHAWVRVAGIEIRGAEEDWIPPEIRGDYEELTEVMTREVAMHDDPLSPAASALSEDEAAEWLLRMVSMHSRIVKYSSSGQ